MWEGQKGRRLSSSVATDKQAVAAYSSLGLGVAVFLPSFSHKGNEMKYIPYIFGNNQIIWLMFTSHNSMKYGHWWRDILDHEYFSTTLFGKKRVSRCGLSASGKVFPLGAPGHLFGSAMFR